MRVPCMTQSASGLIEDIGNAVATIRMMLAVDDPLKFEPLPRLTAFRLPSDIIRLEADGFAIAPLGSSPELARILAEISRPGYCSRMGRVQLPRAQLQRLMAGSGDLLMLGDMPVNGLVTQPVARLHRFCSRLIDRCHFFLSKSREVGATFVAVVQEMLAFARFRLGIPAAAATEGKDVAPIQREAARDDVTLTAVAEPASREISVHFSDIGPPIEAKAETPLAEPAAENTNEVTSSPAMNAAARILEREEEMAQLRVLLREIVREELQGEMGERFSGNLRAVIRREVADSLDRHLEFA